MLQEFIQHSISVRRSIKYHTQIKPKKKKQRIQKEKVTKNQECGKDVKFLYISETGTPLKQSTKSELN